MTRHDPSRADRILDVIAEFSALYGHPPTVQEIGPRVGLASTSAVHHHVTRLLRDGLLVSCACGCGRVRVTP